MSHTPGPWRWKLGGHTEDLPELVGAGGEMVLWLGNDASYYPTAGIEPDEADARLIAAAPDLLEALRRIEMLDRRVYAGTEVEGWNWDEAIFAARDAIIKATEGES